MKGKVSFLCFSLAILLSCSSSNQTTFEEDKTLLNRLFQEIETISKSEPCTDALDWKFAAYGAKACGGPQGFIAYSKQIDEAAFLDLLENYRKTAQAFNEKWGIISDCSIASPPEKIECQDNMPVLIFN